MTRVLDPLSAQLPTADPIRPKIAPASTSRPLIMRDAPVAETIKVQAAPQIIWDDALQLPVNPSTGTVELSRTNGTTATTSQNDSSGPDEDEDAQDD